MKALKEQPDSGTRLPGGKRVPFPQFCPYCTQQEIERTVTPYTVVCGHDETLHNVFIPRLEIGRCKSCAGLVFDNHADDQIQAALEDHLVKNKVIQD